MFVTYDEAATDDVAIVRAVVSAGYQASVEGAKSEAEPVSDESKALWTRFVASLCFLLPLMYVSMGHMIGLPLPPFLHGAGNEAAFALTQFLLALPVAVINGRFFTRGFKALVRLRPNMDSLIAIGAGAAYAYGVAALYAIGYALGHNQPEAAQAWTHALYFESGAMVPTLITLGKYFESRAKGRTSRAIEGLKKLAPSLVRVERDGEEVEIPLAEMRAGDIACVRPGESIPADGVVRSGHSSVDQSAMTGESIPVEVGEGSPVRAGTINLSGFLRIEATKVGEDTTLSGIIRLVEDAAASKAPIARLADRISLVFVPVVIGIALLTLILWLAAGKPLSFALPFAICVLVISCPCAMGLATPVAVMVGAGRGAGLGVLFKSAEAMEKTRAVNAVVLDKTGTITRGKPEVTDVVCAGGVSESALLTLAASLEKPSAHPLAEAILRYAEGRGCAASPVTDFSAAHGLGVSAVLNGQSALGGNRDAMARGEIEIGALADAAEQLADAGKTPMYFARDGRLMGIIAVMDTPKPDSAEAIAAMQAMGIGVTMLTGDNARTANAIASSLGVEQVVAEALPADKERLVAKLREEGAHVAMIGDGVNDAPALTRADVGMAVSDGSDIALESADVLLMNGSLFCAVNALALSRAVVRNIKENLFWAFFYNAALIPLAAGAFYNALGWQLNPMLGAAAMSLSSVCVVSNALRLFRFKGAAAQNRACEIPAMKMEEDKTMTKILTIEGMMCNHCVAHVEKALGAIPGATCRVDLNAKTATVTAQTEIPDDVLRKAVEDAGYTVTAIA